MHICHVFKQYSISITFRASVFQNYGSDSQTALFLTVQWICQNALTFKGGGLLKMHPSFPGPYKRARETMCQNVSLSFLDVCDIVNTTTTSILIVLYDFELLPAKKYAIESPRKLVVEILLQPGSDV